MERFATGIFLFALAAFVGAGSAYAFTLEPVPPITSDGNQRLADPGDQAPMQRLTSQPNGTSGYSFGNSGFSFSITGGSAGGPTSTYIDPSRPPQFAPNGWNADPFGLYRR
ncbi:MAG: hypothetical protein ACHQRJ_00025 [Alphaproteobacteria bacterium]